MSNIDVIAPRLNANEDQVEVVDVRVKDGTEVAEGDLLFVVETTKASAEVLAPASGVVRAVTAVRGKMTDVGTLLCRIDGAGANAETAGGTSSAADSGAPPLAVTVTGKARLRARELGIDTALVPPRGGRIGVEEVEAFAATRAASAPRPEGAADATAPSRFQAVIVGAGVHAGAVADALAGSGWDIAGAIDDKVSAGTEILPGLRVLGGDDHLPTLFAEGVRVAFIGVGGATSNAPRRKIFERLRTLGFFLPPIVHRSAHVGLGTVLGEAACVMPGATVGPRSRVGANVLVNTGAIVSHDAVIGDHAHLTPGCVLGGGVTVGAESTIGMAATVLLGASIGRNTLVHNNATVIGDIGDNLEFTADGRRLTRK